MTLLDGLTLFQRDEAEWEKTLELEQRGQVMVRLVQQFGDRPDAAAQQFAQELLVDIEKWKAMCMRERMVNAIQNPPAFVWAAFYGAVIGNTDVAKMRAIMCLKGFGASVDEDSGLRRAKVASSVLRFLYPEKWGVVDWRTLGIRSALTRYCGNVDLAIGSARRELASDMRELYDLANEDAVCGEVLAYRQMRTAKPLSRAADIEMALFGLSMKVWPFPTV